ncbi:hypothetical protein K438DRAFT_1780654 [Mycena galopus ATCC 62051]|nr:hypothetical protein K438DRAFT_1780654 [Mycena galopus ATCC 62051]
MSRGSKELPQTIVSVETDETKVLRQRCGKIGVTDEESGPRTRFVGMALRNKQSMRIPDPTLKSKGRVEETERNPMRKERKQYGRAKHNTPERNPIRKRQRTRSSRSHSLNMALRNPHSMLSPPASIDAVVNVSCTPEKSTFRGCVDVFPPAIAILPNPKDADASHPPGKNRFSPPLSFDRLPLNSPACAGGGFLRTDLPWMGIVTADEDSEGDDGPSEGECSDITRNSKSHAEDDDGRIRESVAGEWKINME